MHMLKAGLGDMLAKYISICEWRISTLINGEYYCETVAGMIRDALAKCMKYSDGLLKRDEKAVAAVFEDVRQQHLAAEKVFDGSGHGSEATGDFVGTNRHMGRKTGQQICG